MPRICIWCAAASPSRSCLPPSRFRDDNRRFLDRPPPMTSTRRRLFMGAALVIVLAAAGAASYFSIDTRAKEGRKAAKGPPAVMVTVTAALQETVPVRLQAIGNVEPYLTVGVKARVDGQ